MTPLSGSGSGDFEADLARAAEQLAAERAQHMADQAASAQVDDPWDDQAWAGEGSLSHWLAAAEAQSPAVHMQQTFAAMDAGIATEQHAPYPRILQTHRVALWQRALKLLGEASDLWAGDAGGEVAPRANTGRRNFTTAGGVECVLEPIGTVMANGMQAAMASLALLDVRPPADVEHSKRRPRWQLPDLAFKGASRDSWVEAERRLRVGMLRGGFGPADVAHIRLKLMVGPNAMGAPFPQGTVAPLRDRLMKRGDWGVATWAKMIDPDLTALTGVVLRFGVLHDGDLHDPQQILVPHPDLPVTLSEFELGTLLRQPSKMATALDWTKGQIRKQPSVEEAVQAAHDRGSDTPWRNRSLHAVSFAGPEGQAYINHPRVAKRLRAISNMAMAQASKQHGAASRLLDRVGA